MFKQTQIDPCIVIVGLHSIQQTCFGQQWLDHTPQDEEHQDFCGGIPVCHVCLEERIDLLKQILIIHDLRMFPWSLSPRFDENQGTMIMKSDPGISPIIKGTWSLLPTTFLWREMDEMGSSHFIVPSFSEDEKTPKLPRHRLMVMKKFSWQPRGSSLSAGQLPVFCNVKACCLIVAKPQFSC